MSRKKTIKSSNLAKVQEHLNAIQILLDNFNDTFSNTLIAAEKYNKLKPVLDEITRTSPATAPGEQPATAPGEQPATAPGEQPATAPGEQPATAPGEQPATAPGEQPATAQKERKKKRK